MVFKSIRGLVFEMATTWAFSMLTFHVVQDHPVHIPRRRGLVFTRRLVGDDHQIRRSGRIVQNRPLWSLRWADIPQLSAWDARLSSGLATVLATVTAPGADPRPSAFQAGHIQSWRGSCECYALSPVAAACRWLLLLLSPLLSAAVARRALLDVSRLTHPRPGTLPALALRPCAPPLPPSDWLLPPYSPEGRCQGLIRVYVDQALSPVFVALRSDRALMPYRRRMTIRRQSGGGLCSFRGHRGPGGHPCTSEGSSARRAVRLGHAERPEARPEI